MRINFDFFLFFFFQISCFVLDFVKFKIRKLHAKQLKKKIFFKKIVFRQKKLTFQNEFLFVFPIYEQQAELIN